MHDLEVRIPGELRVVKKNGSNVTADHQVPADGALPPTIRTIEFAACGLLAMAVVMGLWAAQAILMPITTGLVVGFLMGPLAERMYRLGVPNQIAAAILVVLFVLGVAILVLLLAVPVQEWLGRIPQMWGAIYTKFAGVRRMLHDFGTIVSTLDTATSAETIPRVAISRENPVLSVASSAPSILMGIAISIGTMYLYLATRRDLKMMAIRLCADHATRHVLVRFISVSEQQVTTYLGLISLVNGSLGLFTGILALISGLSYPSFWFAFAAAANFLPMLGSAMVATALFGAGAMTYDEPMAALIPPSVYFLLHVIESQAITPALLGRRFTVPPLFVFVAVMCGYWIWGVIGAMLATPLLVVLRVALEADKQASDIKPS